MKANEFVKQEGLEEAKFLIDEWDGEATHWSIDDGFVWVGRSIDTHMLCIETLKRLVESHENLELLGGLKKGKEILDGAPVGSDGFVLWTGKVRYLKGSTKCIFSDKSNEWSPANVMVLNLMISFDSLKDVIADVEACQ